MGKTATINDLILQKTKNEKASKEVIMLTVGDMESPLEFRKLSEKETLEYMDMISSDMSAEDNMKMVDYLIYTSCPALQDPNLHEQLDIKDPDDVVKSLWSVADRANLSAELAEFMGLADKDEKIKNS